MFIIFHAYDTRFSLAHLENNNNNNNNILEFLSSKLPWYKMSRIYNLMVYVDVYVNQTPLYVAELKRKLL